MKIHNVGCGTIPLRKVSYLFSVLSALSILVSCQSEQSFDDETRNIGVTVTADASTDMKTKGSENICEPYSFDLSGEPLFLTETVSEIPAEVSPVTTKGAPLSNSNFTKFKLYFRNDDNTSYTDGGTDVSAGVDVSYDSDESNWELAENVLWPENGRKYVKFYAGNAEEAKANGATVNESFLEDGGMQIEYSEPASTGESDSAENETDLLYAYTRACLVSGSTIGLTFHHALAGIRFNFGEVTNGLSLSKVELTGIAADGTCVYSDDEFNWTSGSTTGTLTQAFGTMAADGVTECDNSKDGVRTFFVVPQQIPDDATLTLTFTYDLSDYKDYQSYKDAYKGGEDYATISKDIKLSELSVESWEAGKMYTYTLSGSLVFAELGMTMPEICTSLGIANTDVTSVKFLTGTAYTSGIPVQSSKSLTPIYAYNDSGTLVIYTSAPKIFLKPDSGYLFCDKNSTGRVKFSNMTSIDNMSALDTRNVTNMQYMFYGCSALTTLDVSGFNTSNVTNFKDMFSGCSGLTSLNVGGKFDTSSATDLSYMFSGCELLTELNVSGFSTSKVTTFAGMFQNCKKVTSLDVTNFNTSSATSMSSMFQSCEALTELNVSNFDTSKVTNFGSMFNYCKKLKTLDVSNFNTKSATSMSRMFWDCENLTELSISKTNFNTSSVKSFELMFAKCEKLKSIDVSGFDTSSATSMNSMFLSCKALTSLDVSIFNTAKVEKLGFAFMFDGDSDLGKLNLSSFNTANATTFACMFRNCSHLTEINISSFTTSNATSFSSMFESCQFLTKIDLSNFDTAKVTNMSGMFKSCYSLTSLDLSNFNTNTVTQFDSMFKSCSRMTTLTLGTGFVMNETATKGDMLCHFNLDQATYDSIPSGTGDKPNGCATGPATITCTSDTKTALSSDTGINSEYFSSWTWTTAN